MILIEKGSRVIVILNCKNYYQPCKRTKIYKEKMNKMLQLAKKYMKAIILKILEYY